MKSVTLQTARARTIMCLLGTILGLLFFSLALFAQGNFGRILGTVTDQTGAVIGGATVSIIDTQRGLARTLTTDQAGEYNAPNLIPGTYTVRIEAKGFQTVNRQNVVLEVGKEIRVDLTPKPGEQTQSVTITEAVPLVDTASATLGGTLANAEINDMPLNGRNYQNLLNLRPGVQIQPGGSPWTQSTNNSRPDETVWMLDGVLSANFNDYRPIASMPSPFTDGATILPIDAIQEFNVEENPKAEWGWRPGAVVNVGVKSGTNTLHGSAYAFGRYQDWAARNFFNPAPAEKLPTELKQFGGVAGGAIKKDKIFYFGGYEGLRSLLGNAIGSSVPALGSGPGPKNSMVDAINALKGLGVPLSPVSMSLFGCGTPAAPVSPCTGGIIQGASLNSTSYNVGFPTTNISDNGVGKIDYNINEKNRINGLVMVGNYVGDGADHPVVNSIFKNSLKLRTYTVSANWVYVPSSSVVNEARFGWNQVDYNFVSDDANLFANGKDYVLNTGVTSVGGFPTVTIAGFSAPLGGWRGRPQYFNTPVYDFQDSVSYLRGKHAFKFGAEYTHINVFFNNHDTRGRIDFQGKAKVNGTKLTGLEEFFAGLPSRATQLIGTTGRNFNWHAPAVFVQDDWRIMPKLTVNLGLRYSYISPMKEDHNLIGNFDPNLGMVQQGQPSVGDTVWRPDRGNWSPRAGFAYDLSGKGTTVIRGGFSMIYSLFTVAQFNQSSVQNYKNGTFVATPTGACTVAVPIGGTCPQTFGGAINLGTAGLPGSALNWNGVVFPSGAGISCTAAAPCDITAVNPHLKTPFMENWSLGVQHSFSSNLSLEVGYVGDHGDNLTGFVDLNQCVVPNTGNCSRPYASKFPYLRYINQTTNDAWSNYHSLQATLTKRLSRGFNFTAGYTYGHGLDNGSLNRFGNLPQNSYNPGLEYASSDSDIRHRFTLTATYALPGKKGFGEMLEGWKLNTIVNIQTALPWIIDDLSNDFSGSNDFADRWNFYGNPNDFKSGSSSLPYCTGPGAGGCSVTSGVSGITSSFSGAASAAMWAKCTAAAPDMSTLSAGGCYVSPNGRSVMVPPLAGTFGTMGRNLFRDTGFKNVDFSVFKDFRIKERFGAEFRAEFFNLFNHPILANPYGAAVGGGGGGIGNDPSSNGFGCGCSTPDVAAGNPLVGSGSNRVMQLGLKLTF
jgi:hypothetical protein